MNNLRAQRTTKMVACCHFTHIYSHQKMKLILHLSSERFRLMPHVAAGLRRRTHLHHVNYSQVRLFRWGVLPLHEHQGHLVTLHEDENTGNRWGWFVLFIILCVHICMCLYMNLGYTDICVLYLENNVWPGGFCRQRQHVASHGLSVETIPQVTSIGRDLRGAR